MSEQINKKKRLYCEIFYPVIVTQYFVFSLERILKEIRAQKKNRTEEWDGKYIQIVIDLTRTCHCSSICIEF